MGFWYDLNRQEPAPHHLSKLGFTRGNLKVREGQLLRCWAPSYRALASVQTSELASMLAATLAWVPGVGWSRVLGWSGWNCADGQYRQSTA